jgi:hypothetical protein
MPSQHSTQLGVDACVHNQPQGSATACDCSGTAHLQQTQHSTFTHGCSGTVSPPVTFQGALNAMGLALPTSPHPHNTQAPLAALRPCHHPHSETWLATLRPPGTSQAACRHGAPATLTLSHWLSAPKPHAPAFTEPRTRPWCDSTPVRGSLQANTITWETLAKCVQRDKLSVSRVCSDQDSMHAPNTA